MEDELMKCPFCGGDAEFIGGPENWQPTYYDPDSGGDPAQVQCKCCKASSDYFYDYEDALKAWNKRI